MATSLTTSYAGEYKDKMIASALLSGRTLANGGLTVYPNVAFKEVIKRIDLGGDLITAGACDYADAGTVTIDEAVLEVKEFQINKTECKKTFSQDWIAAQMGYSMNTKFYLRAILILLYSSTLQKLQKTLKTKYGQETVQVVT